MAYESSDSEENALQALLDAFPSAPLELIASAFTQANSDPDLAAEIIAFSLNGISSKPPELPSFRAADQRLPRHCSKASSFDINGLKDTNAASECSASSGACEMHENLKLCVSSSKPVSRVLDGVLHACVDEASWPHNCEVSPLPSNKISTGELHVHGSHVSYDGCTEAPHKREVSSLPSNNISSGELHVPGSCALYDRCTEALMNANQLHDSITLSHRRPLVRPKGPCPPTLEEFFPSSPEKNAWIQPLSEHLQKNVSIQNQQNNSPEDEIQLGEFPSLEKRTSKEKGERLRSSGLPQPLRSSKRSTNRTSAAFGLASSARSRNRDDSSTKNSAAGVRGSANGFKQKEMRVEEKSLWPTETEASLLLMLGEEFNLGIEAVRDVLGHYEGDIEKAFEVLSQLSSSSSKDISLSQHDKEVAVVTKSVERRGISSRIKEGQVKAQETYYAFEEAILKQENSSMKWVVESLCKKYPHAEMETLLEVLRATDFDFNNAEKMLQEAGLHEGFPISEAKRDPAQLANVILESLFSKPQEVNDDKQSSAREKEKKAAKLPEVPNWEVVTSTDLDVSGDEEGSGQISERKVPEFSEVAFSKNEGGNMQRSSYGDWDDYERHRASAKQHWKTMESYLTAATAAYAESDISKAELLTEKGNMYKHLSMEAKERANHFLLEMKSRQDESDFTLDLQNQHVAEALQLLRLHLKSFSSIPSCHTFTVITGCFEDTKSGHIKVKHEVVRYLERKRYDWVETSPFCLQIQLKKANQLKVQGADETV